MNIDHLTGSIAEANANVYRIALYDDGTWYEKTLVPIPLMYQCYSVTKNFTATAIGIAQDKGLLNINDLILGYFENELPETYDKKLEHVTIRHLLTHTMGNEAGYLFSADRPTYAEKNYLKLIFSQPLKYEAGEVFVYGNSNYYLLSLIIHRACGETLETFLRKHLLADMDITEFAFQNCPMGETLGCTGLFISTLDLAKLGVLYLNNGVYNGKQLLSSFWVGEASKPQVRQERTRKYGYSFWIENGGYNGKGDHGQSLVILPERKIVLAAHGNGDYDLSRLL
jgi:CubicO group peptidase (beta-lactamase class C family)